MLGYEEVGENLRLVVVAEKEGHKQAAVSDAAMEAPEEVKNMVVWLT